jgi:hypothetical protein
MTFSLCVHFLRVVRVSHEMSIFLNSIIIHFLLAYFSVVVFFPLFIPSFLCVGQYSLLDGSTESDTRVSPYYIYVLNSELNITVAAYATLLICVSEKRSLRDSSIIKQMIELILIVPDQSHLSNTTAEQI